MDLAEYNELHTININSVVMIIISSNNFHHIVEPPGFKSMGLA